ncbi:MAG: hypothetical protein JKY17_06995 [Magnetovibrio sp.]|nr:hypothetical protein [Magnetovibrio sp.]
MSDLVPPPNMSAEHIIRDELEKAVSLISAARSLMSEGRSIDLSAVEERVRIITETVKSASPEIAVSFKDHLAALLDIIDTLQANLETQHRALEDNLNSMKRRIATNAYGPSQTTSLAKPKKGDT